MDPITIGAVAAPILGSVLGGLFGGGDRDKAAAAQQKALDIIESIGAPPDVAQQIYLQQFQQAGILTPEVEQAIQLDTDQKKKLVESSPFKKEQETSVNALKQLAATGLGVEDQVAARQLLKQGQQATTAKMADINRQANERGQLGAGNTLAAQLAAVQAGDQGQSEALDRTAARASEARRAALQNLFSAQGQLRSTDLSVDQSNIGAERDFAQTGNQYGISRNQRNVDRSGDANKFNIGRQQNVSDSNTSAANAEKQRQVAAKQWMYDQARQTATAKANAYTGQANQYNQNAANTQQSWSNMGSGVGSGLGSIAMANSLKVAPTGGGTGGTGGDRLLVGGGLSKQLDSGFKLDPYAHGGRVEGDPIVNTDHEINDQVIAKLTPKEIVVPMTKASDRKAAKKYIDELFDMEESPMYNEIKKLNERLSKIEGK